jgi:hypothetical protein
MRRTCPVSCIDTKPSPRRNECKDVHENCPLWLKAAECETNDSVKKYCPLSCGRCENSGNNTSENKKEMEETGTASERNMMEETKSCKDNHENCSGWAVSGLI